MTLDLELDGLTHIIVDLEKETRHSVSQLESFLKCNVYFHLEKDGKIVVGFNSAKYVGYFNGKFRFSYTIHEDDKLTPGRYTGKFLIKFQFKDKMLIFKKDEFYLPKNGFTLNLT